MINYQSVATVNAVQDLHNQFMSYQTQNRMKSNYYDGKQRIKDLGISLPPELRHIDTVVGWPGTVVDVLDERLDFEGWSDDDLDIIYHSNDLDVVASNAHTDAFIFGTSFAIVTSGQVGEPDPFITVAPPTEMVAVRDRTGLVEEACHFYSEDNEEKAVLYRRDANLWLTRGMGGWKVDFVDEHNLGRNQVVQMVNRPRGSHTAGRSEITPAIRGYTDMALRTLVGSEVAREFYAVPQRYVLGAPESFFIDEDGNQRGAWDAMMGKILALEGEDGMDNPVVGQFTAYSMSPFFEQIKGIAEMLAAEAAIPPNYLGFQTANPASADAIVNYENRLIKRAERRQGMFGKSWTEVARLSLMVRDGRTIESLTPAELSIRPLWRNPATPTRAAAADEIVKMAGIGVYPADGEYVMKRLGLTPADRDMLRQDRAKSVTAALARLNEQNEATGTGSQVTPEAREMGAN